jgi:UDP-N-acetylglucosamine 4,6-dehydratase/UDP-glucose 4-epimerase
MTKYLITGGSGFLGKALVARLYPANIRVLSKNEEQLLELKDKYPDIEIMVGDISDPATCRLACEGVTGIYHLAAFKHVGLAEVNVRECIASNVIGTINLLDVFTGNFIIGISTDKATRPNGVYGITKLLMERLFKDYEERNPGTKYRIVRYGNVLYSTGSVLCKWREKIQENKMITVTDLGATRFFWTVDQAIDLIFECLEKATDATPFVGKMKSILIKDLLDAMLDKYGHVPVEVIGLQPGENKHELLDADGRDSSQVEFYTKEEILKFI